MTLSHVDQISLISFGLTETLFIYFFKKSLYQRLLITQLYNKSKTLLKKNEKLGYHYFCCNSWTNMYSLVCVRLSVHTISLKSSLWISTMIFVEGWVMVQRASAWIWSRFKNTFRELLHILRIYLNYMGKIRHLHS